MNNDKLLQELAKIASVNPERLQIAVTTMSDSQFIKTYGNTPFARVNLVVPDSVVKRFGGRS